MSDKNIIDLNLKRDLQQITTMIQGYIDSTYLSQIRSQIHTYKRQCEELPCKESQLLQAIVPFMNDDAQDRFSNLIKLITYSQMIERMLPSYGIEPSLYRSSSEEKPKYDYMHQVILALFLYRTILWAEGY